MERSRITRGLGISVLFALFVGVVGGWVLSRSPDDTDANPGTSSPGIPVNTDTTGESFPFVELTTLGGDPVTISTGELRPMVVNFWFSTCEPCKREMPAFAAASLEYEGRIDFVGINPNDSGERATAFMEDMGVNYPNYLDDGDQLAAAKVATMPTTFFLAADGTIVERTSGEVTSAELTALLGELAGG